MVKKFAGIFLLLIGLAGCATTQGPTTADLQMKVNDLEQQLAAKDDEIKDLKFTLKDMTYEVDRMKARGGTVAKSSYAKNDELLRVDVSPETVQQALKAAGYYSGAIDGKLGARTKSAISKFQQDKGLKADGVVGQRTWSELRKYANQ